METQDKALETIRRLLRLGTSSNEHEAELALSKAAELARKHSIDLGCVKAEEHRERVTEKSFESRMAFDIVEDAAVSLCMELFGVKCLFNHVSCTLIGMEHNVEAAIYARDFIIEQCGRDLKAFKRERFRTMRRRLSKGAGKQYCLGWVLGVQRKYKAAVTESAPQLEDSNSALILRKQEQEVADYMESHHGDVKTAKDRKYKSDRDAFLSGVIAGDKVNISRPLNQGPETLCLVETTRAAA